MTERELLGLQGKTVVVTGAGRGVGRGIALAFGRAGANMVLAGRTAEALEVAATAVRSLGARSAIVTADVLDPDDVDSIVAAARGEFGLLDAWINNAGGADSRHAANAEQLSDAQWDDVVDLNLKSVFLCSRAAANAMTRGGAIVNISSRSSAIPSPGMAAYGAAKAGVEHLTAAMAVEWGPRGLRVNAVAPGIIDTDEKRERRTEAWLDSQRVTIPLQRLGTPADVGDACVFLCSELARWVTGVVLPVHGGSYWPVGHAEYFNRVT
jgi:NAD(P)-dependent dehydrogenase (short-subunit alcohol dehydrogenase family)